MTEEDTSDGTMQHSDIPITNSLAWRIYPKEVGKSDGAEKGQSPAASGEGSGADEQTPVESSTTDECRSGTGSQMDEAEPKWTIDDSGNCVTQKDQNNIPTFRP